MYSIYIAQLALHNSSNQIAQHLFAILCLRFYSRFFFHHTHLFFDPMASSRLVLILSISLVLLSSVAIATDHIVGDDKGWTVDFNYTQWTQDKVFRVGDNLVFNYDPTRHNVFKVNGTFFQTCTFPSKNEALSTGKDIIQLKTEGRKWYVCGIADHCVARQMKFGITVLAEGVPAPSSPPSSDAHSVASSVFGVVMATMVAFAVIFT